MKKALIKTLLPSFLLAFLLCTPVFAECADGQVDTNLFGCVDSENGIMFILNIVYTVLTFGVGIAGTIGIVIAGIQYSTARDNEQQMAKAKMRIIQIVIGMAIWFFLFVFLRFLLPGFTGTEITGAQK
ncbi:hypothetical protein IKG73_02095 [Candidatus Saccharibacteria bacterium]|nr:hypothetical protein [Candidatus Saccharibacteria bacterium]